MVHVNSWEEFAKAAERLYTKDPNKVGFLLCKNVLNV